MQGDNASAVKAMCDCIMCLRTWMIRDRLMLNDDKTEFLLLGTKQQLAIRLTLIVLLLVSLL